MIYHISDILTIIAAISVWRICQESIASTMVAAVFIFCIAANWVMVGWLGSYVDPVLNLSGIVFSAGFLVFFLLRKNMMSALFFMQALFHFHAYSSAEFYESVYSSFVWVTDGLILIMCAVDRYGRNIANYCHRAIDMHLD